MTGIVKKMAFGILLLMLLTGCNHEKPIITNEVLKYKYDSLLQENRTLKCNFWYRFQGVLSKETRTVNDTVLISTYEDLLGANELENDFVFNRIEAIKYYRFSQELAENNGSYVVLNSYSSKDVMATQLVLQRDSCAIYKKGKLLVKDVIKPLYIANGVVKQHFVIGRYSISLLEPNLARVKDNLCVDYCPGITFVRQ